MPATTIHGLIQLGRDNLDRAAAVAARACVHTPHVVHFFPDAGKRAHQAFELFRVRIGYGFRYGEAYTTSGECRDVAVWIRSAEASMTPWRQMRVGGLRLLRHAGQDSIARMVRLSERLDRLREERVPIPHAVLAILAVDPSVQGRGRGGRLVRPILRRLDTEGIPCYLETTEAKNLALYEHLGFGVVVTAAAPGDAFPVWGLLHRP